MGGGLVGHWFDSGKERLPKERVSRVGISAKCHHLHDCMAQVILFTLHFSYRGILVTITRGNNWRVLRRICSLIPEWGTETYRELWDIFFILFLFVFSTFFLFITQPMGLLICWFILTIDNVFTLKTSKKRRAKMQIFSLSLHIPTYDWCTKTQANCSYQSQNSKRFSKFITTDNNIFSPHLFK